MANFNSDDTNPRLPIFPQEPDSGSTIPVDSGATIPTPIPSDGEAQAASGKEGFGATMPMTTEQPSSLPPSQVVVPPKTSRRLPRWGLALLGVMLLIGAALLSGFAGYMRGIDIRKNAEALVIAEGLSEQFQLAMEEMNAGKYDLAVQRLEYIIRNDPTFPGAVDKLTEAKLAMMATATLTPVPFYTTTPSPTPDLRGVEELFQSAQQYLAARDWNNAIETLLRMRRDKPDYKAVRVDGMLYIALRNRGVDKILKEANLEGGTYDLGLAEKYGPLDAEARNYRDWVNLYMTGASFWEIDWAQAVYYFGQVVSLAPNLRDASGWTSTQRYQIALVKYGDQLAAAGDACGAEVQYNLAISYGAVEVQPTAVYVHNICSPPVVDTPIPPAEPPPAATEEPTPEP